MNPTTLLLLSVLVATSALAGDFVYLKRISTEHERPQRFELLRDRPAFIERDVIQASTRDIDGLEKLRSPSWSGGTICVTRTSPDVLPARFEVRHLPPGVSYLRSIGGACASPAYTAAPAPRIVHAAAPVCVPRATICAPVAPPCPPRIIVLQSPRPFGWPPYDNPLERRPYRCR